MVGATSGGWRTGALGRGGKADVFGIDAALVAVDAGARKRLNDLAGLRALTPHPEKRMGKLTLTPCGVRFPRPSDAMR